MSDMSSEHVRRLDGRLLAVFLELLRTHNATTAAERLGLSQSAVSHALRRLRTLHDDPLFIRRPHGLEPTRRATDLGPLVEEAARCAVRLYGPGDEFAPEASNERFDVAASEFVTAMIGGPLLHRWSASAPTVSIVTRQLAHDEAIERVRRGEIHLAIGRYPQGAPAPDLTRQVLYEDDYCVVARRDHHGTAAPLSIDAYLGAGHVLAGLAGEGDPRESVPRQLRIAAVVPAWLTALTLVASSDAIATCPRRLALQHAKTLGLPMWCRRLLWRWVMVPLLLTRSWRTRKCPSQVAAPVGTALGRALNAVGSDTPVTFKASPSSVVTRLAGPFLRRALGRSLERALAEDKADIESGAYEGQLRPGQS